MNRLERRIARVEHGRAGAGRVLVSFIDGRLSPTETQARERAEADRLGVQPCDLHVVLLRGLGEPAA
jgi:hypothetical protein